jgi:hypothetical protein
MRSLRGTIVALGAALGAVAFAGLVDMGCGGDTSARPTESRADATADVAPGGEGGTDGGTGNEYDATPDVTADVVADGPPVGLVVAINEATAQCSRWLNCCPSRLDGGAYDLQHCVRDLTTYGWEGTLPRDTNVYSRGHITVNQAKAANCISAIDSFPCGMQTPAQWGGITSACELVIQGTIPSNSPGCISSFECVPGNYCDPTVAGGLCTPLATQGQACNTKIADTNLLPPLADEMCSYLASGQPPLFCDLISNGPDAATCQPLLANGASCSNATNMYYDDQACTPPALCGDNLKCGGATTYPYSDFCRYYGIQDAGGPG